jgi:mono/diheme cytochrome c family protein
MKNAAIFATLVLISACASQGPAPAPTAEERGQAMVEQHCSGCHATGRTGESPAPEAPPFRTLSANYRVDALQEAFAEGITVGHPAMPNFTFAPEDVEALIAYLESIQDEPSPAQQ